jgi:restriction endonuclease S subunit
MRIDSDFYSKENIKILDKILKLNPSNLTDFAKISDGNHLSISQYFTDKGVPYYRGGDIYNFFIEQTTNHLNITKEAFNWNNMRRSHLSKGDVLISIVGAIIGNLSLVKTDSEATCSCKLAIIRPKKSNSELIAVFLKSKYGQSQIQKFRRGTGQTGLILEDFDQLQIPYFSSVFSKLISDLVNTSYSLSEGSKDSYKKANQEFLTSIHINNFTPTNKNINTKSFSSSFVTSGRLDSEYYLPKYEEIVETITNLNYEKLHNLTKIEKSIEPGSSVYDEVEGLPFVRVADLSINGISKPSKNINWNYSTTNKEKLDSLKIKKDTILLSKDGSVGTAYAVRQNHNKITSGAILHLKIKDDVEILPQYLALVLNSITTQLQAERDAGGSIILHWRVGEIEQVLIPIVDIEIQQEIDALVTQSFELRDQSDALINIAKRSVEIAIEENEEKANQWIKSQLKTHEISLKD